MPEMTLIFLFSSNMEQVLMSLRVKEPFLGRLNGLGGKVDGQETPYECAVRELQEESGYCPTQFGPVKSLGKFDGIHAYWTQLNDLVENPATPGEDHLVISWTPVVTIMDLRESLLAPNIKEMISLSIKQSRAVA